MNNNKLKQKNLKMTMQTKIEIKELLSKYPTAQRVSAQQVLVSGF